MASFLIFFILVLGISGITGETIQEVQDLDHDEEIKPEEQTARLPDAEYEFQGKKGILVLEGSKFVAVKKGKRCERCEAKHDKMECKLFTEGCDEIKNTKCKKGRATLQCEELVPLEHEGEHTGLFEDPKCHMKVKGLRVQPTGSGKLRLYNEKSKKGKTCHFYIKPTEEELANLGKN